MKTYKRYFLIAGTLLVALVALVGLLLTIGQSQAQAAQPAAPSRAVITGSQAQPLPLATCTVTNTVRTCDLWTLTGTVTMPDGAVIPIWGFTDSATGTAQLPGPVIVALQGETLVVNLHNNLPGENVSLSFPDIEGLVPDLTGVGPGGSVSYTLALPAPGTYGYEAGLTPNGARQVAMGLYGALVVRPPEPTWAYGDPSTAFNEEALFVLSQIDPAFNNDPAGFDITKFKTRYWLINGKSFPDTDWIGTFQGHTLLMRIINAGVDAHSFGTLGVDQLVIGRNGTQLVDTSTITPVLTSYGVVAESIGPGETLDTIISIPSNTVTGTVYMVYPGALVQHNNNQRVGGPMGPSAFGGMYTYIQVLDGVLAPDVGPVVSGASVSPNPANGQDTVTFAATLSEVDTTVTDIVAAEYFTNTIGSPGTGVPVSVTPGPTTSVSFVLPTTQWPSGQHSVYVRGLDAAGLWGPVGSAVLTLDAKGPDIVGMELIPNPTNGSVPVDLHATADDHENGAALIADAAYSIDGGAQVPAFINHLNEPYAAITATIPAEVLAPLAEGAHEVSVTSLDAMGNWGVPSVITLTIDKTGPTGTNVTLIPNVIDLTAPGDIGTVRVEATLVDTAFPGFGSTVAWAEAYFDTAGPDGKGFPLIPSDGKLDELVEDVYLTIPVYQFARLADGPHQLLVHGYDTAGNWGAYGAGDFTVVKPVNDLVGPLVTNLAVVPNPAVNVNVVTLSATLSDPGNVSNVIRAVWSTSSQGGLGFPMTAVDGAFDEPVEDVRIQIDIRRWNYGTYTIYVRGLDAAGNWGSVSSILFRKSSGLFGVGNMLDSFESGNLEAWTEAFGPLGIVTDTAALAPDGGVANLKAEVVGVIPAYLKDVMPAGERSYRASFYYHPNGTNMGEGSHSIFAGLNDLTPIFGIETQEKPDLSGKYQARAWVNSGGSYILSQWYDLTNAAHQFEVTWFSSSNAKFTFAIDGTVVEEMAGLNTAGFTLHQIFLGPSANLNNAMQGSELFDGYSANRLSMVYLPILTR